MARFDVGSVLTTAHGTTLSVPHGLKILPRVFLGLSATTANSDTVKNGVAGLSVYPSTFHSTDTDPLAGVRYVASTAVTQSTSPLRLDVALDGGTFAVGARPTSAVTTAAFDLQVSGVGVFSTATPLAFAVIGGDDVGMEVEPSTLLTTVAGTTQASSGYGFQPNAALVFGAHHGGSDTATGFSFGFACVDSAGSVSQWSIDQASRNAAAGTGAQFKSASTVSALKLHTTATTAFDVAVTSFRSDGLELTVNASATARAGNFSILGLNVPKVAAGKATITTNGVGAGQTGVTVTGLGQNVGMVILASIGTSLQTLQQNNGWSVGFASSNGNQRSVAGRCVFGANVSTHVNSYFNSTRAVTIFTTDAGGGLTVNTGLFAVTTDGFTVTMNSTVANGFDIYWGAFMNVVNDIEAHMLTSAVNAANLREVTRLSAALQSSADMQAHTSAVLQFEAHILSSASIQGAVEPEFIPGEGKNRAHAKMETHLWQDASQFHDRLLVSQENTSSPDVNKTMEITTVRQRIGVAELGNTKFLRIVPPSTNTVPLRLSAGRGGTGMQVAPTGMSVFTLTDRGGSDVFIFTTESTTIPGTRVLLD